MRVTCSQPQKSSPCYNFESRIPLECQVGVREKLRREPGRCEQRRRLLVLVLLVKLRDNCVTHEEHLRQHKDVTAFGQRIVQHDRHIVDSE